MAIFNIAHQKSYYIFDLYRRRKEISKELYEFYLDQGYADRNLSEVGEGTDKHQGIYFQGHGAQTMTNKNTIPLADMVEEQSVYLGPSTPCLIALSVYIFCFSS